MSFTSLEFLLVFLPAAFAAHWLGPRRAGWQNAVLLVASLAFAWTHSTWLVASLAAGVVVDFLVLRGLAIQDAPRHRRLLLALSVVTGVGQLVVFKYTGFLATTVNDGLAALGQPRTLPVVSLALPVGLSYWTLSKLGVAIDAYYRRTTQPPPSLLQYAALVTFFPALVAGPVLRSGLLARLAAPRALTPQDVHSGAGLFLLGAVGKGFVSAVIGERLVGPVFQSPDAFGVLAHWLAVGGYAIQIFGDFAGYSAMAIGVGLLFGLRLPDNFNLPFLSRSMPEVWRRWHMSLNGWLFDFLYTPAITGQGWLRGRLDLGFVLVFLLSGFWHGARWTYVLWGLLNGLLLVAHRRYDEWYRGQCRKDRAWVARRKSTPYQLGAWALTQLAFVLTLVPFGTATFTEMARFSRGLLTSPGAGLPPLGGPNGLVALAAAVGLLGAYHVLARPEAQAWKERLFALPAPVRGVLYGLLFVFLLLFMPLSQGTFIYAQF